MVDITKIAAIYADAERYGGMTVTVGGWAKTIRDLKTFGFIELNDGSCFRNLQVVMDANILANYKEIAAQNVGAALIVASIGCLLVLLRLERQSEAPIIPTDLLATPVFRVAVIASVANPAKLPVIVGEENMCNEGGLATIGLNYTKLGVKLVVLLAIGALLGIGTGRQRKSGSVPPALFWSIGILTFLNAALAVLWR